MIRSLELTNFRRHEKTRLDFSPDSQIVAITGSNGAGKTTVLEAIQFALHGETRHGRRGVAGLVRRGAEHEGLTVVMEFDIAGTVYRVERRYEKGKHSAALYAGNALHTQTADGVTKAITDLLGMDAVGFRLATVAKQKELDGLAELTPAVRRKTIARILRLDAVQAAVGSARDNHRYAKSAADALTGAASVIARTEALAATRQAAQESEAALTEARAALTAVEQQLGASVDVDAAYQAATLEHTRAEATRAAVAAELDRLNAQLDRLVVPEEAPAPTMSLPDALTELVRVDALLARGTAQQALASQLVALRKRLASAEAAVTAERRKLEALGEETEAVELAAIGAQVEALTTERSSVADGFEAATGAFAAIQARLADARERKERAEALGATCEACGQDIPENHKHTQAAELDATIVALADELTAQQEVVLTLRARGRAIDTELTELAAREQELTAVANQRAALTRSLNDQVRAAGVYAGDIERLEAQVEDIDLDAEYARKAILEAARVEAEAAQAADAARAAALTRKAELETTQAEVAHRLCEAAAAAEKAAPAGEVVDAWRERQKLLEVRDTEREFVAACETEVAAAQADLRGATELLEEATRTADKAAAYRSQAEVAAKTATLLDAVARRMATQIRPQLEGQVSAMLQLMSEGRFTAVQVSDDYDVTVCDYDGKYYPVGEFSGGEADLIALALRLALAQIVSARHGAGGAGFLILDEVFGSQDEVRRRAILEALRRLRATYGQILLISHVGGIEESADMVLSVGRDDEEEFARVAVS